LGEGEKRKNLPSGKEESKGPHSSETLLKEASNRTEQIAALKKKKG